MFSLNYVFLLSLCYSLANSQNGCKTPQNEAGTCVPLDTCTPLTDLIKRAPQPMPSWITDFLRKSFCEIRDGTHYLCCANRHLTATKKPETVSEGRPSYVPLSVPTSGSTDLTMGKLEDISNHPNLKLLPTDCGIVGNNRISNGEDASINEFPFMALLRYDTPQGLSFDCGGSIISKRYILTAAHCVSSRTKLVSVRVGEHTLSTETDCETFNEKDYCAPPYEDIDVEEVKLFPSRRAFTNDVAVIRLQRDINLANENTRPICLPTNSEVQNANLTLLLAAGWGTTEMSRQSDILQKAKLDVIPNDECQTRFSSLIDSQMCAGGKKRTDTCTGDSGGPIFFPGPINGVVRYIQRGIVAAGGRGCGNVDNNLGIYTRTAYYMRWILDQLRP